MQAAPTAYTPVICALSTYTRTSVPPTNLLYNCFRNNSSCNRFICDTQRLKIKAGVCCEHIACFLYFSVKTWREWQQESHSLSCTYYREKGIFVFTGGTEMSKKMFTKTNSSLITHANSSHSLWALNLVTISDSESMVSLLTWVYLLTILSSMHIRILQILQAN